MSAEELKAKVREYADLQAPGWELVVLTIHNDTGLSQAVEVRPAAIASARPATSAVAQLSRR